jgi:hypothetical protein
VGLPSVLYSSCLVSDLTTKQQAGKFAMHATKCIQHIIPKWFNLHFSRLIPQKTPHVSTVLPSSSLSVAIWLPFQTSKSTIEPGRGRGRGRQSVRVRVCVCVCARSQKQLNLCNPMDCSPPGFSVHRIFQARILE